jgi:hypothetical protein
MWYDIYNLKSVPPWKCTPLAILRLPLDKALSGGCLENRRGNSSSHRDVEKLSALHDASASVKFAHVLNTFQTFLRSSDWRHHVHMIWRMGQRLDALPFRIWLGVVQNGKDAGCRCEPIQCRRAMSISHANRAQKVPKNSKGGQSKPLEYRYSCSVSLFQYIDASNRALALLCESHLFSLRFKQLL